MTILRAALVIGFSAIVGISIVTRQPHSQTDQRATNCSPKGDTMAWVMAQEFVRRQLKSPSTADFPTYWGPSPGLQALHLGGCKFEVIGYVDAQNSFGATLRTNYLAEVEYLPASNTWQGTAELFE